MFFSKLIIARFSCFLFYCKTDKQRSNFEIWIRITPNKEYIKVVVFNGKVIGALLIGDTDMEEVFENLILNQLDVGNYGIGLLNPEIDITDYFD